MEKIKDFLYDLSDIFLSLIIVALIFSVVTWKISDIMKTPSISVAESDNSYMTSSDNTTDKYDNKIEVITVEPDGTESTSEAVDQGSSNETATGEGTSNETASTGADGQSTDASGSSTSSTDSSSTQASTTTSTNSSSNDGKPAATKKTYTVTIEIPKGATGYKISKILKSNGLISDTQEFIALATKIELVDKMQSGTYELSSDMSMEQMIKKLCGK